MAAEVWAFLRQNQKLWLLPLVSVLIVLGVLLIFAQSSALAPFIYTIFKRRRSDLGERVPFRSKNLYDLMQL